MKEKPIPDNQLLGPLVIETGQIKREAVKRRKIYNTISVKEEDLEEYQKNEWSFDKELKTKIRIKKLKSIDERLENKLWSLFYRLGYHELNEGRNFQIKLFRKGSSKISKQVDVFAKDDETVIIAECKSAKRIRRKSLQKDIEEFANIKGPIFQSIKSYYGKNFKPKIISLFVTENIIWSNQDKERAFSQNIRIITDRELRYYMQIADHLGHAARYQFLAEFLKGQQIPGLQNVIVPATRGKLGRHKFYSFITTPRTLLKLSFVNHRSLNDPDGVPTYQRLISKSRMKQIGNFISNGGYFPTNILVDFNHKVRFDIVKKDNNHEVTFGYLYLPDQYQSVWIIDGQHKLYGFAHTDSKFLDQNIVVIAFEKLSKEEEANLFVTINHEQITVPKTLLDDLEGDLKWGSKRPSERIGAISARLITILNADVAEPFYNRVIQQGITATDRTCLTVPAIKDGIRRSGLIGRVVVKSKIYELGPLCGAKDVESLDRARSTLNLFFTLIQDKNFKQWEMGRTGFLCTNVSVQAYTMLLASLIDYMESNKGLEAKELQPEEIILEIGEYFDPILRFISAATDNKMERTFKVQFGSGGPREYYFRLCKLVKHEFTDFDPDGYIDWEAAQSEEKIESADKKVKILNEKVQSYIFRKFKEIYGEENNAYFNKGVINKDIQTSAFKKSLDDDDEHRLPLEHYLEFIDYKKIVEHTQHWQLFKSVFDIPEQGEKGYSKNLRWMDRINKLRRVPAHKTEQRQYRSEDFDYIDFIYEEFSKRLSTVERITQ